MSSAVISQSDEAVPAVDPITTLLTSAALIPLDETAWVRVTGDERVRWLNGMASNSIQALTPGQGCYTFFLNAQGRIQADATAFLKQDAILLETSSAGRLATHLDHFIIMDDVELTVLSLSHTEAALPHDSSGPLRQRVGILVVGPHSPAILASLNLPTPPEMFLETIDWHTKQIEIIHAHSPLVPRFELWSNGDTAAELTAALVDAGALPSNPEALNQLRILEGTPLFGTDIRDKDLPQETTPPSVPSRALHFSKGCYLGQEIVERIRSRGNLHRTFSGFTLTGDLPPSGTLLFEAGAPDKSIGELTSVTRIELPDGPAQFALGYVRRETLDRAGSIQYPGGSACPVALPFQIARI